MRTSMHSVSLSCLIGVPPSACPFHEVANVSASNIKLRVGMCQYARKGISKDKGKAKDDATMTGGNQRFDAALWEVGSESMRVSDACVVIKMVYRTTNQRVGALLTYKGTASGRGTLLAQNEDTQKNKNVVHGMTNGTHPTEQPKHCIHPCMNLAQSINGPAVLTMSLHVGQNLWPILGGSSLPSLKRM
jgi:hypothetical protein